jgi:hypothetical protein
MSEPEVRNAKLSEARQVLERFVVDNDDLRELESRIGRFNIFDALGITQVEIRHSNFLAFLLDPAESHGQGQLFLKALLMDLLRQAPPDFPISAIDLDGTDLRGVEVKREWRHIDLLITCKDPEFAVVVENKVGSQEHSDQLNRYRRVIADQFPNVPALYVFLTGEGDDASDESWLPCSYRDVYSIFKRTRDTYESGIGAEVRVFLDHYLNLLGTRFMNDAKIDELCQRIYKNHRNALKLIWDRVGTPGVGPISEVKDLLESDPRWEIIYPSGSYVDVLPKAWTAWTPKYWLCVHIRADESKLWYAPLIGQMEGVPADTRRELLKMLRDECPRAGFKKTQSGSTKDARWSRICAYETVLTWAPGEEPDAEFVRSKMKESLDLLFGRLESLLPVARRLISACRSANPSLPDGDL